MKILESVLSLPTAPFHEEYVADFVRGFCMELGLKVKSDKFGNLTVNYKRGKAAQPVAFVAHMDHPGFEVISVEGNDSCKVGILGGINLDFFAGAEVFICAGEKFVKGRVIKTAAKEMWHNKPVFVVDTEERVLKGAFGWYALSGFKIENGLVLTKAADNLVSVAALLELLKRLKEKRAVANVSCLFTRAEEVGFVGCMSHLNSGRWPKNLPTIVLECSSAKAAKVDIGGGPVVRVGDKMSGFTPQVDCWLSDVCTKLAKADSNFKYQRALLSGGRCEASVFNLEGLSVGGLAFPLGNYHNNAESGYAPEFVSAKDYKWMQQFLFAVATAGKVSKAFQTMKSDLDKNYKGWAPLLKHKIDF